MQDYVYHMTLKSHFISKFCTKTSRFRHYKTQCFYGRQRITLRVICIFNPLVIIVFNAWLYYTLRRDVI